MALFRRFWAEYLARFRSRLGIVAGLMVASVLLQLPTPLLTMYVIDSAVKPAQQNRITLLVLILAALVITRHVFSYLNDNITLRLRERIIFDVQSSLVSHIQRLPMTFFSVQQSGYLQSRVLNDSREIEGALVRVVVNVVTDSLTFIVGASILLYIKADLGFLLLLSVIPFLYIRYYANEKMRVLSSEMQEQHALASGCLAETFAGIRAIKAMGHEQQRDRVVVERLRELREIYIKTNSFGILSTVGASLITSLTVAVILWLGSRSVIRGEMTIGQVVGVLSMASFIYGPVNSFVAANLNIQRARSALRRIYDFLMLQPESAEGIPVARPLGRIELKGVKFGYGDEPPVLKGIDLLIEPGETLALVGRSGVGKSTLVSLLLRLYSPREGSILLDGQDIQALALRDLRASIGLVDQDTFLFSGTILDNIQLGRPEAPRQDVIAAAERCRAHQFIDSLPQRYETQVGERGVRLSRGQCQRIALARLFLRDPAILILDEAVSAVDSESEEDIQSALRDLAQGRTTIVIAHRLSSLLLAHRVVLIEDGRIIEDASHAELLARQGAYSRLFSQQFQPQLDSGLQAIAVA